MYFHVTHPFTKLRALAGFIAFANLSWVHPFARTEKERTVAIAALELFTACLCYYTTIFVTPANTVQKTRTGV